MITTEQDQDWRRGTWMLTHTGKQFWPTSPSIDDLDIADIAHSLSLQCRYNGHTKRFYSVAEHSVLIARALAEMGLDRRYQLWGLMHDAAEAYVGDLIRPIKHGLPEFATIENRILLLIAVKYDLAWPMPEAIHAADNRILLTERAALLNLGGHRWHESIEELEPLDVEIYGWDPATAEAGFLHLFEELTA